MLWSSNDLTEHKDSASRAQTLNFFFLVRSNFHRTHFLIAALTLVIILGTWEALSGSQEAFCPILIPADALKNTN